VGQFAGTELVREVGGGRAVTELVREERGRAGTELVGQNTVRRGENRGGGSPHFTPFQLLRIINILKKQVKLKKKNIVNTYSTGFLREGKEVLFTRESSRDYSYR
jgi:hypothetical protein